MKDYSNLSDEELVVLAQKGEIDAFGFLVEKYAEKIHRYARKFVPIEAIEDISQIVFLKTFKNINSFKPELKFSPWIYRIAHNELVNHLKKKKWLPLFDFDVFFPHLQTGKKEIESEVERKIIFSQFEKCLNKLKPKHKEAIVLFYLENLSYQEISDITQAPISTIAARIRRAKKTLKETCPNYQNN